jgi:SAM-dependent methyltransferase
MARWDAAAPTYDIHRALPAGAVAAIRARVLDAVGHASRPRLLDLGAGSGRIGRAFVAAGDDYIGVDLSLGMLRQFAGRTDTGGRAPRLVRADGARLPFGDAAFDLVLLVQVFGGMDEWRPFVDEARRVLRPSGALVLGRTAMPEDGLDGRMKARLDGILAEMGVAHERTNARAEVQRSLDRGTGGGAPVAAAAWDAARTPRGFLERHRTGARFSRLPGLIKDHALRRLSAWAVGEFGSLDASVMERHTFELRTFAFHDEVRR